MSIEDLVLISVLVFNSVLGLLVLSRSRSYRNVSFFILIFALNAYISVNSYIDYIGGEVATLFLARLLFTIAAYLPFLLNLFILSFLKKINIKFKIIIILNLVVVLVFSAISLLTNLIVAGVDLDVFPVKLIYGNLYSLYYIFIFIQTIIIFVFAYFIYKKTIGIERLQFKYFIVGALLMLLLVITSNLLLPMVGITLFVRLPGVFTIIFTGTASIAIVRHKLFSVKALFIRTMEIVILALIFLFVVLGLRVAKDKIFHVGQFSYESIMLDFVFAVIMAYVTPYFLGWLSDQLNRIIKPEIYFLSDLIKKVELNTKQELNKESIFNSVELLVKESFPYTDIHFAIFQKDSINLYPQDDNSDRYKYIHLVNDISIEQELQDVEIKTNMKLTNTAIVAMVTDGLYITFSNKFNNEAYTKTEIEVITELNYKLRAIFEKVAVYENIKNFNDNLKIKVDEATSEISKQKNEIAEQLRKEKDMMDILGHELRTPLGTARNAVLIMDSLIEENHADKESLSKYISITKENIRREVKILETVLSSTRIENNKLQINFEKVDAKDVVSDTIESYKSEAEKKGLLLNTSIPDNAIFCYAGRDQLQEIVDNLVSNAVKYTIKGEVKIILDETSEDVRIQIIDSGEGIPQNEIPNLGKKFYRINPYLESSKNSGIKVIRPGGTGIGLYVVFNLLRMMNGRIEIQSELGKGSTFTIFLPKAPEKQS